MFTGIALRMVRQQAAAAVLAAAAGAVANAGARAQASADGSPVSAAPRAGSTTSAAIQAGSFRSAPPAALVGMAAMQADSSRPAPRTALAGMVAVPAGTYRPLHPADGEPRIHVAAFQVDRKAVTQRDFLAFARRHPEWRRSRVAPPAADRGYLASWRDDLTPGASAAPSAPITEVSWHAADAYCRAQGRRLPTTAEWEYLAAASETQRDATGDPAFLRRLTELYANHGPGFTNVYGVFGLHGVIWEWTADDGPAPRRSGSHHERDAHGQTRPAGHQHAAHGDPACAAAAIGATDAANYAAFLRDALRASLTASATAQRLGFRCAAD